MTTLYPDSSWVWIRFTPGSSPAPLEWSNKDGEVLLVHFDNEVDVCCGSGSPVVACGNSSCGGVLDVGFVEFYNEGLYHLVVGSRFQQVRRPSLNLFWLSSTSSLREIPGWVSRILSRVTLAIAELSSKARFTLSSGVMPRKASGPWPGGVALGRRVAMRRIPCLDGTLAR